MLPMGQCIDISIHLNPQTPVYPGNPSVVIEHFASASGQSFNSQFTLGTHVGTHIDAPAHAFKNGLAIQDMPLSHFIGPARVIDVTHAQVSISTEDLLSQNIKKGERILLKTNNSERGFDTFYEDYVYLSPEAALYLAQQEVLLVGIDSFSVKQKGSADNTPHTHLLEKHIPILEGINLNGVAEGKYFLVAQPLAIEAGDAAPARAVLIQ